MATYSIKHTEWMQHLKFFHVSNMKVDGTERVLSDCVCDCFKIRIPPTMALYHTAACDWWCLRWCWSNDADDNNNVDAAAQRWHNDYGTTTTANDNGLIASRHDGPHDTRTNAGCGPYLVCRSSLVYLLKYTTQITQYSTAFHVVLRQYTKWVGDIAFACRVWVISESTRDGDVGKEWWIFIFISPLFRNWCSTATVFNLCTSTTHYITYKYLRVCVFFR